MTYGRLIYVMGPSGAGKNSIIHSAIEKLNKNNNLYFSPRYVTRSASDGANANDGEGDVPISAAAFAHYKHIGTFALDWEAHGFYYGVTVAIDTLLRAGKTVVVNGSRAYLDTAFKKYPRMTVVLITVSPELAHARLHARGRENAEAINARVARVPQIAHGAIPKQQLVCIDNSGPIEHATLALVRVLQGDESDAIPAGRGGVAAL